MRTLIVQPPLVERQPYSYYILVLEYTLLSSYDIHNNYVHMYADGRTVKSVERLVLLIFLCSPGNLRERPEISVEYEFIHRPSNTDNTMMWMWMCISCERFVPHELPTVYHGTHQRYH